MAVLFQSGFCNFLGRLHHSCYPSNVLVSDLISPCHSAQIWRSGEAGTLILKEDVEVRTMEMGNSTGDDGNPAELLNNVGRKS